MPRKCIWIMAATFLLTHGDTTDLLAQAGGGGAAGAPAAGAPAAPGAPAAAGAPGAAGGQAAPGSAAAPAPGQAAPGTAPAPGSPAAPGSQAAPAQTPGAQAAPGAPQAPGAQPASGTQTPASPATPADQTAPASQTAPGAPLPNGSPASPSSPAAQAAAQPASGTSSYTWQQVYDRFRTINPTVLAGLIGIDEYKALEITAHLRPNPTMYLGLDQATLFQGNPYRPLTNAYPNVVFNYLHERDHKRELRTESAEQATKIATTNQADLIRTLGFTLRLAFVQVLQSKAILALTKENLGYYDEVLRVSADRLQAGDIAQVDNDRLVLGRVQYESDYEAAEVNLRTAKIQLLQLLNDRTPVDTFDVSGPFGFNDKLQPIGVYRQFGLAGRTDLIAATQAVDKARIDHRLAEANGSTDPVFGVDAAHQPAPLNTYVGVSVNIPLRIFDRNQGEKQRTLLDIDLQTRNEEAVRAMVLADVDAAYTTVESQLRLLRPYQDKYLKLALSVRDTISFSYQHGGASLLDFLSAENDYRGVQLGYLNLVGQYMTAAAQLNQSVGQEVLK